MNTARKFLILALGLVLVASSAPALAKVGDAAPAFMLQDLDGNTHSAANYKGKVLVLFYLGYN